MKPAFTALVLALACAGPAVALPSAGPHASAALRDIAIQVVDLRPDDGIAASYAWNDADGPYTELLARSAPGLLDEHSFVPGWLATASASVATPPSRARAWATGRSLEAEASFASIHDERHVALASATSGGARLPNFDADFLRLAPHTRIVITGFAQATAGVFAPGHGAGPMSFASVSLGLTGPADSPYDSLLIFGRPETGETVAASRALRVSYSNTSDEAVALRVGAGVTALAQMPPPPPVPEPASLALATAGLAALALGRRRHIAA
ncbi:PEP-CTERM sorting domain-containing protein [Eleftheria terrae]|uniref:PEP-CTERM sorting domain-containing protein n=1 Tax=Eleftheria terrae TaxID=1597781 RepID=UPI00263B3BFE|nr:PEP-CTERM sorting domain-containing protein [Eleftheria terrae]WKB51837.1 PEP-CTERM sorting domain-containing protein [Eleftheria terrae]